MSHHIAAANYAIPTLLSPIKSAATGATSTATTSNSTSTASDIGTTFLSLLTQELQNQDPTAPMDSTAMVGQMISLNQLAQLTSINQAVGGSTTSATGAVQPSASSNAVTAAAPVAASESPANQLPFDPNTMMPVAPTATRQVSPSTPSLN